MKKLTCALLVAMLTMITTVFAQSNAESPEYIMVTNKTTNESTTINFGKFNYIYGAYECSVPKLLLGIYENDEIVVSYGSTLSGALAPRLSWKYTIGYDEYNGGSSFSLKFTVPKDLRSDNLPLTVEFDYQKLSTPQPATPAHYILNFENKVVNDVRFFSEYSVLTHELRVNYVHFNEVRPYLKQAPVVSWYNSNGLMIGSGSMDRNGTITFDTKGLTGWYIVKVVVNGVNLPAEKILLY